MKFGIETLLSLICASGVLLTCARRMELIVPILILVFPITLMSIAITSPKGDHHLDTRGRWLLSLLAKSWALCFLGAIAFFVLYCINPALANRIQRAANGDTDAYILTLQIPGDEKLCEAINDQRTHLYDNKGFVGKIRNAHCPRSYVGGQWVSAKIIWITVGTDRTAELSRPEFLKVELRERNKLYVIETPL